MVRTNGTRREFELWKSYGRVGQCTSDFLGTYQVGLSDMFKFLGYIPISTTSSSSIDRCSLNAALIKESFCYATCGVSEREEQSRGVDLVDLVSFV